MFGWQVRWRGAFSAAFPHTVPVLTGFGCLGMAYGVLMNAKGYGPLWSTLMSAVAFCGSMQYVAITLLTVAFDPIGAFFMSLLVNARHLFYGLSLLKKYKGLGGIRFFLIYGLCDETFSVVCGTEPPEGVKAGDFYLAITILNYCYWVTATFVGGVLGNLIQAETGGLDFALTALFVVLFLEQWRKRENRVSALIGVACTGVCLFVFGSGSFIIPAMALVLIVLLTGRRSLCK